MKTLPPVPVPRVVKPRKPKHTHRFIVALTDSQLVIERTGMLLTADQLPHVLCSEPSSIIVCQGFGPHLDYLIATFGTDATFQYRVTPKYFQARDNDGAIHPTRVQDALVNFVGFRNAETADYKTGRRWTRYHYPIDPVHFARQSVDELYPEAIERIYKLLRFAQEVREFCLINQLEVKPSAGGLAAQLLRDSRFYPEPRRKMPTTLNKCSRSQLPGNYYQLHADEYPNRYTATYLDISNAHHEAAKGIRFPDVNTLHAFGRWAEETPRRPFRTVRPGEPPSLLLSRLGLFHCRISVPHLPASRFPLPFMRQEGIRDAWVYSNELDTVEELGGEIQAIHTALISPDAEQGLNRYARFAVEQIREHPDWKPWLKPTLHAAYGILAARPTPFETGFHRASDSLEQAEYPMGRVSIPVRVRKSHKPIESAIANVIHRGMIEADVRCRVLAFARALAEQSYNVLAVYADSLFVEGDAPPLLAPPWRVAAFCTNLRFHGPTHFVSDQEARLPGIPRNLDDVKRQNILVKREILISSLGSNQPPERGNIMPQSRRQPATDASESDASQATLQVPEGWASVLFDKAFELAEQYEAIVKARKANRESLRNLAAQSLLSDDEREMLAEIYPERTRKTEEAAEAGGESGGES